MPRTPDRFPGTREEESIVLDDTTAATLPGEIRYTSGGFSFYDSVGAYDPRSGGGGITESQHEGLDTLAHNVNETSYDEILRSGGLVTNIITWDSVSKQTKIREEVFTRSGGLVTQIDLIQYDSGGTEDYRITEAISRSGGVVVSITRTKV